MTGVAIQSTETIEFPCEEWAAVRTPQGELVSVNPVPGTWTLLAPHDRRDFARKGVNLKALFACPRCRQIGFISEGFNPPKELGDTKPLPELHCRKCQFGCKIILKDWDKRRLYCACYETSQGTEEKDYFHAEDEREAKKFFWAQHTILEVTHLIAIAPVIGFFLENPKDETVLVV